MKSFSVNLRTIAGFMAICAVAAFCSVAIFAQTQAAAADLSGTVADPNGAVIPGASVTIHDESTGITRTATSNAEGSFQIIAVPPGTYDVTIEAKGFKKTKVSGVKLTVGQALSLPVKLEVGGTDIEVNVDASSAELIEVSKTGVSNTIDQERIASLPINERSATGFALTLSTVGRDNGRPVGPAPTSGLNIGGTRGRSTLVQVDGADFTDNSTNASRSTVGQEAVQEYQISTNSYAPEFGRATGGIVNLVTKRGKNNIEGNVFGFGRHKTIQARNAFAPAIDGDPNKKPPFTRAQYGLTFSGPIEKDKTHFFFAFEQRRRQESGFFTSDITRGATGSVTIGAPILPISQTFTGLTPEQVTYIQNEIASGIPARIQGAVGYAHMASIGTQTALNGRSNLVNFLPGIGIAQGTVVGQRFLISGMPVPLTRSSDGQFVAFRPLAQLARIFPISEATTFNSLRFDHAITANHQMNVRVGFNPSRTTGIQDESQNQTLGQNDFSRTGIPNIRDLSISGGLTSILPNNIINEANVNFGRRSATFDSQVPSVAHQIAGTGFIGSNPFSPVSRIERRFQVRDNVTLMTGNHNIKFGGDFNLVDVDARFDLNFPALFNFSAQSCSTLLTGCTGPSFTPVQTYGLGFPSVFIQGFGNPNSTLQNKPIAFFVQDSWKMFKGFTLTYGVRYDVELTDQFSPTAFRDPLTGINLTESDVQTAQDALNVTQGFPRDKNNFAPRVGFAWDVLGDAKTVVRGAIGMFYDHPLLAVGFNSDIADGSQQQQSTLLPIGGPSPTGLFNAWQVFHGTAIPGITPGLAASAQYLQGFQRFNSANFTGFGPILPFTLHVGKNFEYPYAIQANLSFERQIGKDSTISVSGISLNSRHLAHPQDVNPVNLQNMVDNFRRFTANNPLACGGVTACGPNGRAPVSLSEAAFFSMPTTSNALYTVVVPGLIAVNNTTGQRIVSPIAANYFRKLGPNYFFVQAITGGAVNKATFDNLIAGSLRSAGPINPYSDVNAQVSDGNSSYNALNIEYKKRISSTFQFLASYTWSHAIDDSSDLQTLLKPQNNLDFKAERSDSLFDQRHRFVFSGAVMAPEDWKSGSIFQKFAHGFTIAPIIELSSGRPFNILAVGDNNGDFQSTNERPSVLSNGLLCQTGVDDGCFKNQFGLSGNLGRNMGITHGYASVDLRVMRRIQFGERFKLDLIAEGFNLFNRFNEAAANSAFQVVNAFGQRSGSKYYSQSTSAFDPRQFQFGFKLGF